MREYHSSIVKPFYLSNLYAEVRKKFGEARHTFSFRKELSPQVQTCLKYLAKLDELEEV
jgi:hypothetical protein